MNYSTFKGIYDNGCLMLGDIQSIINETEKEIQNSIDMGYAETQELLNELKDLQKDLGNDLVVMVNYDNPMGYSLDWWTGGDRVL